jgi:hypothetical protein
LGNKRIIARRETPRKETCCEKAFLIERLRKGWRNRTSNSSEEKIKKC